MTVADLKGLIESETKFPHAAQHLYHNGQLLADPARPLDSLGIADGEMLALHVRDAIGGGGGQGASGNRSVALGGPRPTTNGPTMRSGDRSQAGGGSSGGGGARAGTGGPDPEMIRLQILGDPRARAEVQRQNPELAGALDHPEQFRQLFHQIQHEQAEMERERQRKIAMLNDDPFNVEAQAQIEESIRQEAVMENLQNALEHHPEAFGKVHMLYIDVEVNGHQVKAFVDSGAQATIMSPSCAEACGIMRLVDKRFAGIARGVGTARIIGRVHSAQIKIGRSFLACSFTVMEGKDVDLLLGLDMLKRHQACIDLRRGQLIIQDDEVPFLGEADIPKEQQEIMEEEPTVEGPGGAKMGGRSGAVLQAAGSTPAATFAPVVPGGGSGGGQASSSSTGGASHSGPGPAPSAAPTPQQAAMATTTTTSHGGGGAGVGGGGNPRSHSPEAIEQLQMLGFSREEAVAALDATGGNVDYAAGLLFQER
ncbi:MAG: Nucleolar GTP-binding protein 1 [Watsoniomyces obsoletus]|nr:MAG: Nucleolar GTP-binding protein 1 [Watsoniomyces obsoletus]